MNELELNDKFEFTIDSFIGGWLFLKISKF